ncbi:acetyltransferase [Calothrix sp. 336/3]|nr:acetyltransferase [Calothrix sp. 336/3]
MELPPGYSIRRGSTLERSLLVKFMQRTYQEMTEQENFAHLAYTVEQYFSSETPLWWVEISSEGNGKKQIPIACLWLGNAIDQVTGDRHTHIFLLYVLPEHRRQGIGKALMIYAENWAINHGDKQISLQVFANNHPAINLYHQLNYQTQSLWMKKFL